MISVFVHMSLYADNWYVLFAARQGGSKIRSHLDNWLLFDLT